MKRRAEFSDSALRSLSDMGSVHRRFVLQGIKLHLLENDPTAMSRNKFPLKRPSAYTERELRLGDWRVFYATLENDLLVMINLIGHKRGNKLFIEDEEFEL